MLCRKLSDKDHGLQLFWKSLIFPGFVTKNSRLKWFSTCRSFPDLFLQVCLSPSSMTDSQTDVSVTGVTVYSLGGDVLLEPSKVFSIADLADESARKLNAKKCRMVSTNGRIISELCHLTDHERLTAVAQNVSPLLQLVGLQNAQGDPVDGTVALEQLEQIALEVATTLAHIACWFGSPQHLAGHPSIPWKFGNVLPAPPCFNDEMHLRIHPSTPVVHLGALVKIFVAEPWKSPGFQTQTFRATRELTVDDIIKIRSAHQEECNKHKSHESHKSKLLETAGDALAIMRLVRYTTEEVVFELGHRAYKLGDDLWRWSSRDHGDQVVIVRMDLFPFFILFRRGCVSSLREMNRPVNLGHGNLSMQKMHATTKC